MSSIGCYWRFWWFVNIPRYSFYIGFLLGKNNSLSPLLSCLIRDAFQTSVKKVMFHNVGWMQNKNTPRPRHRCHGNQRKTCHINMKHETQSDWQTRENSVMKSVNLDLKKIPFPYMPGVSAHRSLHTAAAILEHLLNRVSDKQWSNPRHSQQTISKLSAS